MIKDFYSLLRNTTFIFLLLFSSIAFSQRIVGYTTSWSGDPNQIDYDKLTHINYAFALPTSSGSIQAIENAWKLSSIVSQAHSKGVKVLIAIGGWELGDGGGNDSRFNILASTASGRTNFVNSVLSIIQQYGLDGADIDWEFPEPVNGAPDANYTALMSELATALHSRGLLLTAAVNGSAWAGDGISAEVFGFVDWLNIMAYDGGEGADHSPYSYAVSALNYYKGRGLPADKAVVGVPFYARPSWKTYSTLLAEGANPYSDTFNGDYYNGITTIKSKTSLVKQQGGGIMIWTIDQDVQGENSLLKAIADEMNLGNPDPTGVVTLYQHCPYDGYAIGLSEGSYTLAQLQAMGMSDNAISSIKVQSGYKATLYDGDNFTGDSLVKTSDDDCIDDDGFNDRLTSVIVSANTTGGSTVIEAENYSNMSGVQVEPCNEGGENVGYIDAGDWMAYAGINFPVSGNYLIEYRVASESGGGVLSADLNAGATVLGQLNVPSTGGWQNWTTISHTVYVTAGTHAFGIYASAGGWNLNWIKITSTSNVSARSMSSDLQETNPEEKLDTIEMFPNPATNELNINGIGRDEKVFITDFAGNQIKLNIINNTNNRLKLDVSSLPAGIYFIKAEGTSSTLKFIKN
ncbi:glycosyl hydrolase family 18 protein [Abyssalbus ytuae]|uniref:chitinase n=1 Tax=Abyssalbus ytuae TaxID=2926907 RepID=A0A9E7A058_9FLAO|nr:glycosyl hydrolase family 18 protein [Abyssalbus ytuae]UOB18382.1 glycosyl hydrolase family 18 protein [Abyssalbus ytuae]